MVKAILRYIITSGGNTQVENALLSLDWNGVEERLSLIHI